MQIAKNAFVHLLLLFSFLSHNAKAQDTIYFTDSEGDASNFLRRVNGNDLVMRPTGQIDFAKPGANLVFGGDLGDRGKDSIKLRAWLTDLKKRYPNRVTLLWGNRDLNKVQLLADLPNIQNLSDPEYVSYLQRQGADLARLNTPENQLKFWFQNRGAAGDALENHRAELEAMRKKAGRGRPVSERAAALHYLRGLRPGGEQLEYLKAGQLLHVENRSGKKTLYVHGGITPQNYGRIPGAPQKVDDLEDWIKGLNRWGKDQIVAVEQAAVEGRPIPTKLSAYGDAIWDPDLVNPSNGRKGMVVFNDISVVYPFRSKDGDNFRPLSADTSQVLRDQGVELVVNGHSPSPGLPTPVTDGKVMNFMADTSFSNRGGVSQTITHRGVAVEATYDGTDYRYVVPTRTDSKIGAVTSTGHTIVGTNNKGDYVLVKYSTDPTKRFSIDATTASRQGISALNPQLATGGGYDVDAENLFAATQKNLIDRGKQLMEAHEASLFIGDRTPVMVTAYSKFGKGPESDEVIRKRFATMLDSLDAKKTVLVTGGTDFGGEKILHELAKERGFEILGVINQTASGSDIKFVDHLMLVKGSKDDWVGPGKAAVDLVKQKKGAVVAVGGGGVVKQLMDHAISEKVPLFAMSSSLAEGGASAAHGPGIGATMFSDNLSGAIATSSPELHRNLSVSGPSPERVLRDQKFNRFLSELNPSQAKVVSYTDLVNVAKRPGRKTVVLGGFSGAGYENPEAVRAHIEKLVRANGSNALYVIGGTPDGIGQAYDWIPEIAKAAGLENVETAGIVSRNAADYGIAKQDYIVFVDTAPDAWEVKAPDGKSLFVDLAEETKGSMIYFKGGPVSRAELQEGIERGVKVAIVHDPLIQPHPKDVEKKLKKNPLAKIDQTEDLVRDPRVFAVDALPAAHKLDPEYMELSRQRMQLLSDPSPAAPRAVTYEGLNRIIDHDKLNVEVLGGFSGLDYENPEAMLARVEELVRARGDNVLYIAGGTSDGIGRSYKRIEEVARKLGFKNVKTAGIVSQNALKYGVSPNQDFFVPVDTPVNVWDVADPTTGESLMVDIAKRHGGNMTYFGGGEISVREMNEATQRGVPVRLVQGDAVKPNSAKVSKRIEKDPKFVAEPTRSISKRPGLETIGPSQKFAKATPVVAIPSGTSDAQRLERILKTIAQNGCL